jgi:hypothetical protein
MELKPGTRLACPQCTVEVVVVRPPSAAVVLTCDGVELVDGTAERPGTGHAEPAGEGVLVGKRYSDETSGLELLCAKAGQGSITADGRGVAVKGAKPLPSSD